MKDSTGNCWENLKINNFSMLVGSEINLIKNLSLGGTGCVSGTTQIFPSLVRKVFEKKDQKDFEKMCAIRRAFDATQNLVTAIPLFFVNKRL